MHCIAQTLYSQKTLHTSPLRASYGVSFVSILAKNNRVMKGFYCICLFASFKMTCLHRNGKVMRAVFETQSKTCRCSCLESQIINKRLKKIHKKFLVLLQSCWPRTGGPVGISNTTAWGWLPWSSQGMLNLALNISCDDRGSHPDDFSVLLKPKGPPFTNRDYWCYDMDK